MPTFGSLFSGIGGIDLGLERAGWECRWQVENDPYCQAVLRKHWPDVPKYGDVREVTELEPVELIAGGFPCQPWSHAGLRRGADDERWLWPEFARIVRLLRPRVVLVENVTGLLDGGLGFVLADLAGSGFDAEWSGLSACAVGAPHTRQRVFVVAYANGVNGEAGLGSEQDGPRSVLSVDHPACPPGNRADWTLATEAEAARDSDGSAGGLDRLRVERIGNAVVPQVAEWIGRKLMAGLPAGLPHE